MVALLKYSWDVADRIGKTDQLLAQKAAFASRFYAKVSESVCLHMGTFSIS